MLVWLGSACLAQNENKKWYFGNTAGLDFMTTPPTVLINGAMINLEGVASIADPVTGNILFYTNGLSVWDQTHAVMANGTGLQGSGSSTQSGVIVKQPGSASIYYIFTVDQAGLANGLKYSIVDMSLAAGMGSVTVKNTPIYSPSTERITAVRHCNGIDTWVISHDWQSDIFRANLVTTAGLSPTSILSPAGNTHSFLATYAGYLKASPNGRKLGMAVYNHPSSTVEIYDFDNATGVVSNSLSLGYIPGVYGCEFSPDGTKFYTGQWNHPYHIFQWDLCAGSPMAVAASIYTVTAASNIIKGALQLGPDSKIYVACVNQQTLAAINSPNAAGAACNYVPLLQSISPRTSSYGLPNFITSGFKQPPAPFTHTVSSLYGCQTASFNAPPIAQNLTLAACSAAGYSLTGMAWNFGDPSSGAANTSTLNDPYHQFTSLGSYTTALVLYYSCGGGTDTIRQVVTITQPCLTVSSTSITCASLGSATVLATGGIGPYSYTWMPTAQTSPVANGLSPGTYTVTVKDIGNNFTYTQTVTFTSLIPLTGSVTSSPSITCNGAATGSAGINNIAGGSGSQTYLWSNGLVTHTVPSPQNLTAGLWTYTVTDGLTGCTLNNAFLIAQPPALSLTLATSSPSTCTGSSVTLTGTVSGGTPPSYSYTWSGGTAGSLTYAPVQNTGGIYTYSFSAMDSYSCTAMQTITLNVVPNPTLVVVSASICPLGTATMVVGGASTYSWNGVAGGSFFTDSPLASTVYTVSGNIAGCTATSTASITLLAPPGPAIIQSPLMGALCQGDDLVISTNTAGTYSWTGPLSFTSALPSNTIAAIQPGQAGAYQLTVTAANGCTAATSATILVKPLPLLSINPPVSAICLNGSPATLTAVGNATLLSWLPAASLSAGNTATVSAQPAATTVYSLTGTLDGCSLSVNATVNVLMPPAPVISLSSTTMCAQGFNASANTITLGAGGAASYTILTPPHIGNSNPTGPSTSLALLPPYLLGGPATVTLTGSNGICALSTTATLAILPNPVVNINSVAPVICAGQSFIYTSTGAASYTWASITPGQSLSVSGNTAAASPTLTSIYSVAGSSLGCNSASQNSTLTVNPLPVVSISPNPAIVCLGSGVKLVAGGTGTGYAWSPAGSLDVSNSATVQASPTGAQNYLVISSLNSCTASAMVSVGVLPLPTAAISVTNAALCRDSRIVMSGTGGAAYSWAGPTGLTASGQDLDITALSTAFAGIYTLTVSDANGCRHSATQPITIFDLPSGSFAPQGMQGCVPFVANPSFIFSTASAQPGSMSWQLGGLFFSTNSFSYAITAPGAYVLRGSVTDLNSCSQTFSAIVTGWPKPVADFYFDPEKPVEGLDEIRFTNASTNAVSFNWYFGSNTAQSFSEHPRFLFGSTGTYPVALVASSAPGCSDSIVKPLVVFPDFAVYVPNAFTPNGDGLNDTFGPVLRGARAYTLVIMDRWGEKIFQTSNFGTAWDGSFKGKACKEDVYNWMLEVSSETYSAETTVKKLTGEVVLYR